MSRKGFVFKGKSGLWWLSVNAKFEDPAGRAFACLDCDFYFVGTLTQIVSEDYGTGIVQAFAVAVKKVDVAFAFSIDEVLYDPGIGAGDDKGSDGPTFEFEPEGLAGGMSMEKRSFEVSFALSPIKAVPVGFGKFPSFGESCPRGR